MAREEYPLSNLTEKIIGAAFQVHNRLGQGFQEKVYENALVKELRTNGLRVEQQKPLTVMYVANLLVILSPTYSLKETSLLNSKRTKRLIVRMKINS